MLVKELIEKLKEEDPGRQVVMATDSEGNSYSPLSSLWTAAYSPESTWTGEVHLEPHELTKEMQDQGYTEEDVVDGKEGTDWNKALVFTPTS